MSETDDVLTDQLAPYRATVGVKAALLISHDGFLVAANADESISIEAVAAQIAGVMDIGRRLADELEQAAARYISIEMETLNVLAAPFNDELMLVLIGEPSAIKLSYTLRDARS